MKIGALEKKPIEKRAFSWNDIKSKIDEVAFKYATMDEDKKMALNSALSALAGAGAGAMIGGEGNRGKGAILGGLLGGAGGATATKLINTPDWLSDATRRHYEKGLKRLNVDKANLLEALRNNRDSSNQEHINNELERLRESFNKDYQYPWAYFTGRLRESGKV